jgi:hypothetical protein
LRGRVWGWRHWRDGYQIGSALDLPGEELKNCGSATEPRQRVPRDAILHVAAARRRARIPATTVAAIVRMVPAPPRPPRSSSGPKPTTLHRGSHDILPGPGTPQEPHAVPAGTSARGQLGRVGMGQRRSDRRAVPSRYAGDADATRDTDLLDTCWQDAAAGQFGESATNQPSGFAETEE